jgi:hypothetical protein
MPQVEVRRLHYRGAASQAGRIEFAVGEALRTETADDGRLVLVRSLRLGRIGFGQRGASRAAAAAWRDLIGSARHGGSSGAESAGCVWFASLAEARALLLRELARGRRPFGWFWTLAVPDWRRMTLEPYLAHRLEAALAEPSGEAIAALLDEALAADAAEALAAAILARVPAGSAAVPVTPVARSPTEAQGRPAPPISGTLREESDESDRRAALEVLHSVPPLLRSALGRLTDRSSAAALLEPLARGLVRRLHPALALTPARIARIARLVVQALRWGEVGLAHGPTVLPRAGEAAVASLTGLSRREARSTDPPPDAPAGAPSPPDRRPAPADGSSGLAEALSRPPAPEGRELASAAAGMFLAIVPLIRLGWREWLAERPDLLLHQPGARLLHLVAAHHRVPPGDAVWRVLPGFDLEAEPPGAVDEALALWRAGLDGWLRRKARITLAGLVLRRGWLLPGPETTAVRFPLGAIDLRLRRLALDSDPGWVDWLGHSYRLVYRDRPQVGPQAP